jgi:glycyl-tRNA synthetase
MNPKVWEASGHISSFHDPLVECSKCHKRYREDHLLEGKYGDVNTQDGRPICPDKKCGGTLLEAKQFNLMFKTFMGPVESSASVAYLRPETAQGIFVNFKTVLDASRKKLPFGIAQIGKAFRNEITPGNFTFRTREFEQMEIEWFCSPESHKTSQNNAKDRTIAEQRGKTSDEWHKYWLDERYNWYLKYGIKKENIKLRKHAKNELAHYAKACSDLEYKFPFGWSELEGIANRKDFDLSQHEKFSGKDMKYFNEETKEKFWPYVIEPSAGADRATLAFLVDAYDENEKGEVFLRLHPKLAPYKVAIFPLVKKDKKIVDTAKKIYDEFKQFWFVQYDETGSVGRRYRRQDEIGTPYCITVDFDSEKDKSVTVRDRDTMKQDRVKIKELAGYLMGKIC